MEIPALSACITTSTVRNHINSSVEKNRHKTCLDVTQKDTFNLYMQFAKLRVYNFTVLHFKYQDRSYLTRETEEIPTLSASITIIHPGQRQYYVVQGACVAPLLYATPQCLWYIRPAQRTKPTQCATPNYNVAYTSTAPGNFRARRAKQSSSYIRLLKSCQTQLKQNANVTSSSAIAERPRCRVG